MPVPHKRKNKSTYYALTSFKMKIITYQLTAKGEDILRRTGIYVGERFGRGLLLDLIRSGDAYTLGVVPSEEILKIDPEQLDVDLENDPDSEGLIPTCDACHSPEDGLHFVGIKIPDQCASILCKHCRVTVGEIDFSVPLPVVNRTVLKRLLEVRHIMKKAPSVVDYQRLLEIKFQSKWEEVAKKQFEKRCAKQGNLFGKDGMLFGRS